MNQPRDLVRKTEREQIRDVEHSLKQMRERLLSALPVHIPVQLFVATVLTACSVEPKLLSCDRHSLFLACLRAARDGLLPDGREAALAPYWNEQQRKDMATYMPMYPGLLKKVRNSGELQSLSANAVYANDHFEYELGDDERIVHRPEYKGPRGEIIAAYAIAKVKNGGVYRRVLTAEEVEEIKAFSKAKKGPWTGKFESEMWVKSAIRRLSKILPQSTDINSYLNEGPRLPAGEAESVLPDATGEEGTQSQEYVMRSQAMLALDESGDRQTLEQSWSNIKEAYERADVELPLEVEDAFRMRQERFTQS